jgi:Protein of unknown function (DUF2442)
MIPSITSVIPIGDHILTITFTTGEVRSFDMKPYLNTGIFQELKKESIFQTARINFGTVEWQNGADFDPESLYAESKEILPIYP